MGCGLPVTAHGLRVIADLWLMVLEFPANQGGRRLELCDIRGYRL